MLELMQSCLGVVLTVLSAASSDQQTRRPAPMMKLISLSFGPDGARDELAGCQDEVRGKTNSALLITTGDCGPAVPMSQIASRCQTFSLAPCARARLSCRCLSRRRPSLLRLQNGQWQRGRSCAAP